MKTSKLIGEYLWAAGISLIVVGATKIFSDAIGILIAGVIIYLVGATLRSI